MGRSVSESPSTSALSAAESEDQAREYAEQAADSVEKAESWAEEAALYANQASGGGINTVTVFIYQRRALNIAPSLPLEDSTYSFRDRKLDHVDNGWSMDLPSDGGDFLFVTYAMVTAATGLQTADCPASLWAEPQLMSQSGTGETTSVYWMTRSSGVLQKDTLDRYTPQILTFKGLMMTGNGPVQEFKTRFTIAVTTDGTNFVNVYTSSVDESSGSYTPVANLKAVRIRMHQPGSTVMTLHEELVPVVSDGISYTVKIESTNGDTFRVGQPTTTLLKAHVFRNGVEVTNSIPDSNFRWRRISLEDPLPPNNDAAWNAAYATGYKQISLTIDSVFNRATFHCDILVDD
jgi:hypothetical protein